MAMTARGLENSFWTVRNLDTEHGLPGPRVLAVGQGVDGYLWVGTSAGLARFDGVRFQPLAMGTEKTPGESNVTALCRAGDRLFYAARGGSYGEIVGRGLVPMGSIPSSMQVLSALPREGGELWLGSSGGRIWTTGSSGPPVFQEADGLPRGPVTSMVQEAGGQVWALAGNRLVKWTSDRWVATTSEGTGRAVDAITSARGGGLWVATASAKRGGPSDRPGIWFQRGDTASWHSTLPNEDPAYYAERIAVLFEDHEGRLWCGVRGGGLFYQEPEGEWSPVGSRDMLARMTSLFEDADGVLWASTEATGLCRISRRLVAELRAPGDLAPPVFWTACATRDGDIWGGTDGAGLFRWRHDGTVQTFTQGRGLPTGQILCLLEDRAGVLHAGTRRGLFRFGEEGFALEISDLPELLDTITALHEDPQGTLWVGTDHGVMEIAGGKVVKHGTEAGLPDERIRGFANDDAGALFAAVYNAGLYRREGAIFRAVTDWTAGASIRSVCPHPGGGMWIATSGRWLFRYDGKSFIRYGREDGVPNQYLQAIVPDTHGNLWCASDLGIFGAPLRDLQEHRPGVSAPVRFWRLLGPQGMPNKAATGIGGPTASRGPDGRIWFPNGTALAGLDPSLLPDSTKVRAPFVEAVLTGRGPVEPDHRGLHRIAHRSAFHVEYTSPDTFYPERLSFRTQLVGLDAGWVEMDGQRRVSYPDLAPGSYTFRVAVSAPGGDWIEAAFAPRVEIVPAFFDRRSTRTAIAVAALVAVAGTVWLIERGRNQRRLAIAATKLALEAERQRIARDLHDELGAGLTDIMFAGDHLAEDLHETPQLQPDAERIAARARELARSIEEVVWSVNPTEDTLDSFLIRFQRTAQEHLGHANLAFRWDAPLDVPPLHLPVRVRHALLMAGKEAITNAIKHAGARAVRVRVRFDEPPGGFTVVIEDDGRGFDAAAPPRRGYGLGGLHSRLTECGGVCRIESTPGAGTRVEFSVPAPALTGA
jgi:signal transduction histidine kinase/ligand-binding sensor domain-containing protein